MTSTTNRLVSIITDKPTCGCCGLSTEKIKHTEVGSEAGRGTNRQVIQISAVATKAAGTCDCGCEETPGCECGCECCGP